MPSMLMVAGLEEVDYLMIYRRNYSLATIEYMASIKARTSKETFLDNLSQPDALAFVVFICTISAIGIFGA